MHDPELTERLRKFKEELIFLINRYSIENMSNTPDYILANHLMQSLYTYNITHNDCLQRHSGKK